MDYEQARKLMVQDQILGRGIRNRRVLEAMKKIPREEFVPLEFRRMAYRDRALPIGEGQTISQPYVVGLMTDALEVKRGAKILDVGTGSGYQAAIFAELGAKVISIERQDFLARSAMERLRRLGYGDVEVIFGDGSCGWPSEAPFDGIVVAASGPTIPTPLLEQLKEGGHLVMPVARGAVEQELVRITSLGKGRYERRELGAVVFVPLIGKEGWDSDRHQRWW